MAKQLDVGVSNVARKGKKGWCGVGDKASKIKKMWIGDANGKARLFFCGSKEFIEKVTATDDCYRGKYIAGATIGNHAIFAGGDYSGVLYNAEAYDTSLTKTTLSSLAQKKYLYDQGATFEGYAIFPGGVGDGYTFSDIDRYDSSLTKSVIGGHTNPGYGIGTLLNYLVYGMSNNYGWYVRDTSFTFVKSFEPLQRRYNYGLVSVNDKVIAAGGCYGSEYYAIVEVIDNSLTITALMGLSTARYAVKGATVAGYTLFAGGNQSWKNQCDDVDAYSPSLTKITAPSLSVARSVSARASHPDCALFAGGQILNASGNNTDASDVVDSFDESLTRTTLTALTKGSQCGTGSATLEDMILFTGGTSYSGKVDVYKFG